MIDSDAKCSYCGGSTRPPATAQHHLIACDECNFTRGLTQDDRANMPEEYLSVAAGQIPVPRFSGGVHTDADLVMSCHVGELCVIKDAENELVALVASTQAKRLAKLLNWALTHYPYDRTDVGPGEEPEISR